jgi:hypothetical protein
MAYPIKKADNSLDRAIQAVSYGYKLKQMRNFADHAGYKGLNMV